MIKPLWSRNKEDILDIIVMGYSLFSTLQFDVESYKSISTYAKCVAQIRGLL